MCQNQTQNTCAFCKHPVFNDDQPAGSIRRADGTMKHYHIECLASVYPDDVSMDAKAEELFGEGE